jgi:hypothetical protein
MAGHMVTCSHMDITVTVLLVYTWSATWSHGHMVWSHEGYGTWFTARHWSGHHGLGPWSHGHIGREGTLVIDHMLHIGHWSHAGRYVSHGHMVTWTHGRSLFVTWSHGHIFNMVTWSHGDMIHGHMVTWSHALVAWSHGHIPHTATSHGHNGRYGPPSHGHVVTWSHGHMVAMVTVIITVTGRVRSCDKARV